MYAVGLTLFDLHSDPVVMNVSPSHSVRQTQFVVTRWIQLIERAARVVLPVAITGLAARCLGPQHGVGRRSSRTRIDKRVRTDCDSDKRVVADGQTECGRLQSLQERRSGSMSHKNVGALMM